MEHITLHLNMQQSRTHSFKLTESEPSSFLASQHLRLGRDFEGKWLQCPYVTKKLRCCQTNASQQQRQGSEPPFTRPKATAF